MIVANLIKTREREAQGHRLTAVRATFLVASHHGMALRPKDLPTLADGDMSANVSAALIKAGFRTRMIEGCLWETAAELGTAYPALVSLTDGRWVILVLVVTKGDGPMAAVLDPIREQEGIRLISKVEFMQDWTGRLLLVQPAPASVEHAQPFGLAWFMPAVRAQKSALAGVAVAVLAGSLISFSLPLLFQSIVDRVNVLSAWNTLWTIVTVFVVLASFDAAFGYVRQRLMLIARGKIDAIVGGRTFAHLLALPLSVFETIAAGIMVRHIQ